MGILEDGFQSLVNMGVFEILLPFILIFAIVFGVMVKVNIFGEDATKKKFAVVIALVMGLVAVFQHMVYRGSQFDVIDIINKSLPQVALVLVAIVMLFLILGLFGGKPTGKDGKTGGIVGAIALVVILYIFGSSAGLGWWNLPYWLQDYQIWSIVVVILVFGLIIRYITGDDKKPEDKGKSMENLGKFFGFGGDK